jgi:hypothetical protein
MPAKRHKNFRSGDLAEQLGLLIMQNVALVAPVPRTEDVGIDSVVTLLEDHDQYSYIATDSFFLQIKTKVKAKKKSQKTTQNRKKKKFEITYKKEAVEWLYNLELPFFVAVVDKEKQSLDLFCCHRISEAYLINKKRKKLILNFENYKESEFLNSGDTVSVGPPILSISLSNCRSKKKKNEFIKVCKSHIKAEKLNLKLRESGVIYSLNWKKGEGVSTNEIMPLKLNGVQSSDAMRKIYDHCNPYITALADHSLKNWNSDVITNVIDNLQIVKDTIEQNKNFTNQNMQYQKATIGEDVFPLGGGETVTKFDAEEFFTGKKSTNEN